MKLLTSLFLLAFASTANAYVVKETTFPANWPTAAPTEEIVKWGESDSPLGSGATISYSFNTVDLASLMPSGYENILISAFDTWSSVADLSFNYSASDADIVFGTEDIDNKYGTLAYASVGTIKYTETNDSVQLAYSKLYSGGIFFDTNDAWSIADTTPSGEFDLFTVALHEVGHALGLLHEDDTIDGNNISIMNTYYAKSDGLLQDDIDGIQYLYGVTAVPEPSTYLLFLLGLTMLLGVSKKRRLGQAS